MVEYKDSIGSLYECCTICNSPTKDSLRCPLIIARCSCIEARGGSAKILGCLCQPEPKIILLLSIWTVVYHSNASLEAPYDKP